MINGRGLPTPPDLDPRIVTLVRDARDADSVEAQHTRASRSGELRRDDGQAVSHTRESLYWVSPQESATALTGNRRPCRPWGLTRMKRCRHRGPIIRTFAAGPAISKANALLARDIRSHPQGRRATLNAAIERTVAMSKKGFVRGPKPLRRR